MSIRGLFLAHSSYTIGEEGKRRFIRERMSNGFVGVSKTERKSGSDGNEVIAGGAKQQGCWLGNNHIILCTPSSSPIHDTRPSFGVDQRNVMILYSFKLKELTTGGSLMH